MFTWNCSPADSEATSHARSQNRDALRLCSFPEVIVDCCQLATAAHGEFEIGSVVSGETVFSTQGLRRVEHGCRRCLFIHVDGQAVQILDECKGEPGRQAL